MVQVVEDYTARLSQLVSPSALSIHSAVLNCTTQSKRACEQDHGMILVINKNNVAMLFVLLKKFLLLLLPEFDQLWHECLVRS